MAELELPTIICAHTVSPQWTVKDRFNTIWKVQNHSLSVPLNGEYILTVRDNL